jgi:PEP-CTERM/exosortase A-associated glycosyltransferase
MRILHVLDHSLPLHSGYSFRTAAILREQRALGWETSHLTTPRHGAAPARQETADGWTFHRTEASPGWLSNVPAAGPYLAEMQATARRLDGLIEEFQPDVLHAHSPVLTALPALRQGQRHRVPVVYEVRAIWEDGAVDHGTTASGSTRYRLTRALETFVLRHADQVTTICEGLRREICSRGVAVERVTVIPNAVDPQRFAFDPPADEELRSRLGLAGKTVLGFIGSFYGYEGLEMLVESFALLCRSRADLRLLLVGGGMRESAVRRRVSELGLDEQVIFAGSVPHDAVQRYYSIVDVFVYPRLSVRVTEIVTPLKPLEAMAQGRIVVASNVGGHRELIRDGETGFLFAAGDVTDLARTVERIVAQRETWDGIRRRARCHVESERTWKSSVARYAAVYEAARSALVYGKRATA